MFLKDPEIDLIESLEKTWKQFLPSICTLLPFVNMVFLDILSINSDFNIDI